MQFCSCVFFNTPRDAFLETPPSSPPPSPPEPAHDLKPPCTDMLTREECDALYVELLAGNAVPESMPDSLKAIIIADSGCGTDMPNHKDQCAPGSMVKKEGSGWNNRVWDDRQCCWNCDCTGARWKGSRARATTRGGRSGCSTTWARPTS